MPNILVLCTGNSCRSQMAEGYLRHFIGSKAHIYSAGVRAEGVNTTAIAIMLEDGVDIAGHTSNTIDEYLHLPFDYVITVCDHANEKCPYFPGSTQRLHQNFPDPTKITGGSAEEVLSAFRHTRELIKDYCEQFAKEHFSPLSSPKRQKK